MFDKSDKYYFAARIVLNVLHLLAAVLFLVVPVLMAIFEEETDYLIYLVGVPAAALSWLLTMVLMGVVCDIKLIRNKLYCEDGRALSKVYANGDVYKLLAQERIVRQENGAELKEVIAALQAGEITREEYAARVEKLWQPIDEQRREEERAAAEAAAAEAARAAEEAARAEEEAKRAAEEAKAAEEKAEESEDKSAEKGEESKAEKQEGPAGQDEPQESRDEQ